MKKLFKFIDKIIFSILLFSLSSCDLFKSEYELLYERIQKFSTSLYHKNKEEVRSYFAKNKIKDISNFDQSIDELFDYYQGDYISSTIESKGQEGDREGNYTAKWDMLSFNVETDIEKYRMAFYWCIEYTTDKDMLGIWSFSILKWKDDPNPNYAYWGETFSGIGINIGIIDDRYE